MFYVLKNWKNIWRGYSNPLRRLDMALSEMQPLFCIRSICIDETTAKIIKLIIYLEVGGLFLTNKLYITKRKGKTNNVIITSPSSNRSLS